MDERIRRHVLQVYRSLSFLLIRRWCWTWERQKQLLHGMEKYAMALAGLASIMKHQARGAWHDFVVAESFSRLEDRVFLIFPSAMVYRGKLYKDPIKLTDAIVHDGHLEELIFFLACNLPACIEHGQQIERAEIELAVADMVGSAVAVH